MKKISVASKIGILPILQEFPIYGADVNRVFLNRKRAVLSNTGIPGDRSMGLVVSNSRALTDVNLADEDTNSI